MSDVLSLWREKVVIFDGAMGTALQEFELSIDDYAGHEGCPEILCSSRPEVMRRVHAGYLEAGCDIIETNTFGGNRIVLAEYGLADRARELACCAAALAREMADDYSRPGKPRFVAGSMGPGTRLPSLGQVSFRELQAAFEPLAVGLIEGGADLLMIETCQDPLQLKAAIFAARAAMRALGRKLPILASITVETTGAMLVGTELAAAAAIARALDVDVLGLNCATGPREMRRFVKQLAEVGPERLSVLPNAGLPENANGEIRYPMGPEEFARLTAQFVSEYQVGAVGGCCGTTAAHIRELVRAVEQLPPPRRKPRTIPAVTSLYRAVSLRQTPPPLIVGERTNANGSKRFRQHLLAEDLDGQVAVAREQAEGGAHVLDLSVAYVGRDEQRDMARLVPLLATQVDIPLMIDSTNPEVIRTALELHGGRCIVNSINLEDGRQRLDQIATLAKEHGAALIALTIDEQGMARSVEHKLAVAERIYRICTEEHGLRPEDLIVDMLTFTVASGDEDSRRAAVNTLEAIRRFKTRFPRAHTILGVSNVSFGLKQIGRRILNSVFLALAVEAGLDMAIVNARGILPLARIDPDDAAAAKALLLDDRTNDPDPLMAFIRRFQNRKPSGPSPNGNHSKPPDQRLTAAVLGGRKSEIEHLIKTLLQTTPPLEIINTILIPAMRQVGELFAAGKMQLPFVLQSAEVMKSAVKLIEPHLDHADSASQGTLVLATVRGDVHDIGKNLVDIILSNNGFRVINLGIRVSLEEMLAAAHRHHADAIGMSGLLVKSTIIMKENLEEMARRGETIPVLLGGAALNRKYVEEDLRTVYAPGVHYGADAFEGLRLMQQLTARTHANDKPTPTRESKPPVIRTTPPPPDPAWPRPPIDHNSPPPQPPAWETRIQQEITIETITPFLNRTALIRGRWRYRRGKQNRQEFDEQLAREIEPLLQELLQRCTKEKLIQPATIHGYWPCRSQGETLIILDRQNRQPLHKLTFPRRRKPPHWCIADFFRPLDYPGPDDVIALFACTVGPRALEEAQRLFQMDRYRDYLHLHGLAVEMAEATAEWLHLQIRKELGIAEKTSLDESALASQKYRGARYSFGYPACPDLSGQRTLFQLLHPERIGIQLTETDLMTPEASVSAIVVHHPQARYFTLD
jgi:5-methyltetrahydrofolate--homocysteine methyltransferase